MQTLPHAIGSWPKQAGARKHPRTAATLEARAGSRGPYMQHDLTDSRWREPPAHLYNKATLKMAFERFGTQAFPQLRRSTARLTPIDEGNTTTVAPSLRLSRQSNDSKGPQASTWLLKAGNSLQVAGHLQPYKTARVGTQS